jgi:hypothetical protein
MMNTKEVADILRTLETKTPRTLCFDNEINDKGERKYSQKKHRWWDNVKKNEGMSGQQDHVVAYFMCRYYHGTGYQVKCKKECYSCYCNDNYMAEKPINDKTPKDLYDKMDRPEMYIWLIEALEIVDSKRLKECIQDIKAKIEEMKDTHHQTMMKEIRHIIEKRITWEDIEKKLNACHNNRIV